MGSHRQSPSLCLWREKDELNICIQRIDLCLWASLSLSVLEKLGLRNFTASVFMQPRSSCDPTSFWTWQMDWLGIKASSFLLTLADSKVPVKLCEPQTVLWRSSWSCFGHSSGEEHHWQNRGAEPPGFLPHPQFSSQMGGSAILPSWSCFTQV